MTKMTQIKALEKLALIKKNGLDTLIQLPNNVNESITERHNSTLKGELEKAHQDKDVIQNHYDNYMRQMQTLIQQKAIEAPGEKKKWWKFW